MKFSITKTEIEKMRGSIISIIGEDVNQDFNFVQKLFNKLKKKERSLRNTKELKKKMLLKNKKYSELYFKIRILKNDLEILEKTCDDSEVLFCNNGVDCLEAEINVLKPLFSQGAVKLKEAYPDNEFDLAASREDINGGISKSEYRLKVKANPIFITQHGGQAAIINVKSE